MSDWVYQDKPFTEDLIESSYGFVYQITHVPTGKTYIGRKYFTSAATKQVKGKRKKYRKESDWKDYWGSSDLLKKDIELHGKDQFKREIIKLCKNRTECSYWETKLIFEHDALLKETFYNSWVTCKITEMHLKSLKK